jgi:hypothetical protein
MKFFSPLNSNLLPIYFIILKLSMGIFRKSQKVSSFNFDPKGVEKGLLCDPGPEDPPTTLTGLRKNVCILNECGMWNVVSKPLWQTWISESAVFCLAIILASTATALGGEYSADVGRLVERLA